MDLRWCSCFTFCNSNPAVSLFLYSNFISFHTISYVLCSCIKPCYFIFLNSYFRATVLSFGILATPATGICTFAFEVCYVTFLILTRFCISVLILKFLWPICVCIPSQWALQPKIPTLPWLPVTLQVFCHCLFTLNICYYANWWSVLLFSTIRTCTWNLF